MLNQEKKFSNVDTFKYLKATAIYSGGGQYLFYAEITDEKTSAWLIGDNQSFAIVSANPLKDNNTFEKSGFSEWQEKNLIRYVDDSEHNAVLKNVISAICSGRTFSDEWKNYQVEDLLNIYNKL